MSITRHCASKRLKEVVGLTSLVAVTFLFAFSSNSQDNAGAIFQSASSDLPSNSRLLDVVVRTEKLDPRDFNNTAKASKEILFFNRVPKVGSQTTMELLKSLAINNDFHFHKDRVRKMEIIKLLPKEERDLARLVMHYEPPAVYIKHVCFSNFSRFDIANPIYFNLVRDPVERVISWYYYVRAPWYFVERKQTFPDLQLPPPDFYRKSFETCVGTNDPECRYIPGLKKDGFGDHRRQTMFFCGHEDDCTGFNTEIAMMKAKENVEKHYAVVGVLEDLNKTLTVLEHYIPRFFKGATTTYWNQVRRLEKINKNMYKPAVAEETKELVRRNFTREIEFYEFCKQRLHKQYLALNLDQRP